MVNNYSYTECDLLGFYLLGRWNVFLDNSVAFQVEKNSLQNIYDLLRDLIPSRVKGHVLSPKLVDNISQSQLLKLYACRSSLTDVLIAISLRQTDALVSAKLSVFSAYLLDVLNQCCHHPASWIEHLISAYQLDFLCCLRSYECAHSFATAGALPSRVTVVLGMHRSGTSALTGMLHGFGLGAPKDALGATESNPFGYWESSYLVELSNRLLKGFDTHWSTMLSLPSGWITSPPVAQWVSDFLRCFSLVFKGQKHPVIKDPRLCILLEPLLPCLHSGLVEVDYILIARSPIEVIASLNKSEGIDYQQALNLWIASVLSSERLTRQSHRRITTYAELLSNPKGVLQSCSTMWNVEFELSQQSTDEAVDFVDVNLFRQKGHVIRESIIADNPNLSCLLDLAERIFDVVSSPNSSDNGLALDLLRREWNQRYESLQASKVSFGSER